MFPAIEKQKLDKNRELRIYKGHNMHRYANRGLIKQLQESYSFNMSYNDAVFCLVQLMSFQILQNPVNILAASCILYQVCGVLLFSANYFSGLINKSFGHIQEV